MELEPYDFWKETLSKYDKKKCPMCGKKMGVKKFGNFLCYVCESCPNAINLEENVVMKKRIVKSIQINKR